MRTKFSAIRKQITLSTNTADSNVIFRASVKLGGPLIRLNYDFNYHTDELIIPISRLSPFQKVYFKLRASSFFCMTNEMFSH